MTSLPLQSAGTAYLYIFVAGAIATYIWRFLGVYLAGSINEDAEILVFVRCLATALVAAVIAKLVIYPSGALAETNVLLRFGAVVAGFAAYMATGKKVFVGVLLAEAVILATYLA